MAAQRMTVNYATLSEDAKPLRVARGAMLSTILLKAGHEKEELEELLADVRVNGKEPSSLSAKLKAGDFITVAPKVQGGLY